LEPGFARVSIAPVPAGLTWARGRVPTPRGEISVAWESDGRSFRLEADVPTGTEAVLSIPIQKDAPMQLQADGATIGTDSEGRVIWTMPNGGCAVVTASPKGG